MWSRKKHVAAHAESSAAQGAIDRIDQYIAQITEIYDGFVHTARGINIGRGDQERLQRLVMEMRDFLGLRQGLHTYSREIVGHYQEGRRNWLESSSLASVAAIRADLGAARQRVVDSPEAAAPRTPPKEEKDAVPAQADLEKVTRRRLFDHVPLKLWAGLVALLAATFMAGVWVASNPLIRQLRNSLHENS